MIRPSAIVLVLLVTACAHGGRPPETLPSARDADRCPAGQIKVIDTPIVRCVPAPR